MKKMMNKAEEIEIREEAEAVQEADELTEEELDEANGGVWIYVAAFLAGAYAGDQIRKAWNKKN